MKEREREGEREKESERASEKVLQRISRDRDREKEDKETIKKKVVVVDTFLFSTYPLYRGVYISRLSSFFYSWTCRVT